MANKSAKDTAVTRPDFEAEMAVMRGEPAAIREPGISQFQGIVPAGLFSQLAAKSRYADEARAARQKGAAATNDLYEDEELKNRIRRYLKEEGNITRTVKRIAREKRASVSKAWRIWKEIREE